MKFIIGFLTATIFLICNVLSFLLGFAFCSKFIKYTKSPSRSDMLERLRKFNEDLNKKNAEGTN